MNRWEAWGKRLFKGLLWAPVYFFGAILLGLTPSWQLLLLVIACDLWGAVLDVAVPSEAKALSSQERA